MGYKLKYKIGTAQDTAKPKMVEINLNLFDVVSDLPLPEEVQLGQPFSITLYPKKDYAFTLRTALMENGALNINEDKKRIIISTTKVTGLINITITAVPIKLANKRLSINMSQAFIMNSDPFDVKEWTYWDGLILLGMLETYDTYENVGNLLSYVVNYYNNLIDELGIILIKTSDPTRYNENDYDSDVIQPGYNLFRLMELSPGESTSEPEKGNYYTAIEMLAALLDNLPRLEEPSEKKNGHPYLYKAIYTMLHWLDGLFMIEPFKVRRANELGELNALDKYIDVCNQLINAGSLTYDSETGLYRHAYAGAGSSAGWNSPDGRSYYAWGRALGWYLMAISDVLDNLPKNLLLTTHKEQLITILTNLLESLLEYLDDSGVWRNLPTEGNIDQRNCLESTCSCMYAYALIHGVRMGYLPKSMTSIAKRVYEAIIENFIEINGSSITLTNCAVDGDPGKNCTTEELVLNNYYSLTLVNNDSIGIGSFIRASVEYEKMFMSEL